MGFDYGCVLNLQSVPGEYFCPVCRYLVYPNEALQTQCTHLYCKPCLSYVVGTTRACPYDGYLVTQPDKPIIETNKALAETISKIGVRCLYYTSGCQWLGQLSDSSSHCAGCRFGDLSVVCNRCSIQIVHRQVYGHAHICAGVHPEATQAAATQNLAATVVATPSSGGQAQITTNSVAQTPGTVPFAVPNPEQMLYQQQYVQLYPGQYPYHQAYQIYYLYPVHPQAYPQSQQQVQPQSQPLIQSQLLVQTQVQAQPQGQPHPQQPLQTVSQMMPQFPMPQLPVEHQPQLPQPHPQAQLQQPNTPQQSLQTQSHPHNHQPINQILSQNTQPQIQHPSAQAVLSHHSCPPPHGHQQMQSGLSPTLLPHPLSQYPQQLPPMGLPQHSQYPHLCPQVPSGLQPQEPQNHPARPPMPNHEAQPYPDQAQIRTTHLGVNQHLPNQTHQLTTAQKEHYVLTPAQVEQTASTHTSDNYNKFDKKNFGQSNFAPQYPFFHQQRPDGPAMLQPPLPLGPPPHRPVSGQLPYMLRPQGPTPFTQPEGATNLYPDNFQGPPFERPPSQYGPGPGMPSGEQSSGRFNPSKGWEFPPFHLGHRPEFRCPFPGYFSMSDPTECRAFPSHGDTYPLAGGLDSFNNSQKREHPRRMKYQNLKKRKFSGNGSSFEGPSKRRGPA